MRPSPLLLALTLLAAPAFAAAPIAQTKADATTTAAAPAPPTRADATATAPALPTKTDAAATAPALPTKADATATAPAPPTKADAVASTAGGTPPEARLPEVKPSGVRATATQEKVRLGEPFVYEISLEHPKAQRFDLRPQEELGAFGLLGLERHREDGATSATTTFRLKLALYELGARTLPTLTFDVAGPEGDGRFPLPGAQVEGLSSIAQGAPDAAKLLDIREPRGFTVRGYRTLLALAALALLAAAVAVLARKLWALRGKARRSLPLDERTREALQALAARNLPAQGRTREFYFALSDVLRGYLAERYRFDARECTRTELLERLRHLDTPGLPYPELTNFLREADFVKFARAPAEPGECAEALAFGHRLVDLTTPPPAGATDAHPALGTDASRDVTLRTAAFCEANGSRVITYDAADFGDVHPLLVPIVMNSHTQWLIVYSAILRGITNLDDRVFMGRHVLATGGATWP